MTLPFQFIPALSLPLPWPSFWNSRKRATSPPLLPSRSVSRRQHAVIPPPPRLSASHWMPAAQLATLTGLFLPPKCSCLFPLVFLRFSRRCGSRRGRRPGRSSGRKIWASLATPHSCTASARRWWTRIRMRWGPLTLSALTYCTYFRSQLLSSLSLGLLKCFAVFTSL